jgi:soluble lytic murein transglycosylase-like protein
MQDEDLHKLITFVIATLVFAIVIAAFVRGMDESIAPASVLPHTGAYDDTERLEHLLLIALQMHGIPEKYEYACCIIGKESEWRVDAFGNHGEIGLAQIKPGTGRWFASKMGWGEGWDAENSLYDAHTNLYMFAWGLANDMDEHWTTARLCRE